MLPETLPPAFQRVSNTNYSEPRHPRSQSLTDRCILFTSRDYNSQIGICPQHHHVSPAFVSFVNVLPAATVGVFESVPIRKLLKRWLPASSSIVNGIGLTDPLGTLELQVPFLDKDNYVLQVSPQQHCAAINRDDSTIVVWGSNVPHVIQLYLEIVYRLIYHPLHYTTTYDTFYNLPFLESEMLHLSNLGGQSSLDWGQGAQPLRCLPEIMEYTQQHSLSETLNHGAMKLWMDGHSLVARPSPLGVFSLLDTSTSNLMSWDNSNASSLAPPQLTISLSDISPPPLDLISPPTSSTAPSPLLDSPGIIPEDTLESSAPSLLTFPELRDNPSLRASPEPALRPSPVTSRQLRPRTTKKATISPASKPKSSPRKISPLPARARSPTAVTPDFLALSLSSPPRTPDVPSLSPVFSAVTSSTRLSLPTLSPVSVCSDETLVEEGADSSDCDYAEKPAKSSGKKSSGKRSTTTCKRTAMETPPTAVKRPRYEPVNIAEELAKKPLHLRDKLEIQILYGMKGVDCEGEKRFPCGFGCLTSRPRNKKATGRMVMRTFTRRTDSHRHMNSCPIRPKLAPPPKVMPCYISGCDCKTQDKGFVRKDALQRHMKQVHAKLWKANEKQIKATVNEMDRKAGKLIYQDIIAAWEELGLIPAWQKKKQQKNLAIAEKQGKAKAQKISKPKSRRA